LLPLNEESSSQPIDAMVEVSAFTVKAGVVPVLDGNRCKAPVALSGDVRGLRGARFFRLRRDALSH
jgi:hypothetical protein